MYLKHIYLSGGSYEDLQYLFSKIKGVVEVTAGQILLPITDEEGILKSPIGVKVSFNPKKVDLSSLFDILFSVINPYKKETGREEQGIYYESGEDEPQVEYYINFLSARGKPPVATSEPVTVNDSMSSPRLARKSQVVASRVKGFSALDERMQYRQDIPPEKSRIDFSGLLEKGLLTA